MSNDAYVELALALIRLSTPTKELADKLLNLRVEVFGAADPVLLNRTRHGALCEVPIEWVRLAARNGDPTAKYELVRRELVDAARHELPRLLGLACARMGLESGSRGPGSTRILAAMEEPKEGGDV